MSPYAKVTLLIVASSAGPVATRLNSQINVIYTVYTICQAFKQKKWPRRATDRETPNPINMSHKHRVDQTIRMNNAL